MTSSKKPKTNYDVGYGKPPVATRFPKGQSGNPTGRPKGRKNFDTVILDTLAARIVVMEGGRRVLKSKFQIAVMQLANKAAAGDLRAIKQMHAMLPLLDGSGPQEMAKPDLANDRIQARKIFERLAKLAASAPQGPDAGSANACAGDSHESD